MLDSPAQVIRCLLTYVDWWQPSTGSILQVAAVRRKRQLPDGFHPGLLETLDERAELRRRILQLDDRDRQVLYLWYFAQLAAADIGRELGISRRQCFRRRARAVRKIVELGEPEAA